MSTGETKLLPCPFCGGEATYEEIPSNPAGRVTFSVGCTAPDEADCPGFQLMTSWPTKKAAASAWNRRAAAPQPAPAGEPVARVKPLVWEDITEARSDEDPTRELTGDYEAVTPVGTYYIEMYFGTVSYGWDVSFNGDYIADRDDPDEAKAVALAHFNQVILSTLEPTPPTVDTDAVRRAALEEALRQLRAYRTRICEIFEAGENLEVAYDIAVRMGSAIDDALATRPAPGGGA